MTDDAFRHGLSRLETLITSGTPEARDLADRAHDGVGSPAVCVALPSGPWTGRAVLVDARADIVVAHVAVVSGDACMTLKASPHGRAWLMSPADACVHVLERGAPVAAQQVEWPAAYRTSHTGAPFPVLVAELVEVGMPTADALDALLADPSGPLDADLSHAVQVATWGVAIRHLLADLTPDRRGLADLVLPRGAVADVDHLVALQTCLSLPNPSWVAAGVGRHPILLDLFARPHSTGEAPHAALSALAAGTPPFVAARTAVMEALYVDGVGPVPVDAVVRGLANLRGTEDMMAGSLTHVARLLGTFHAARPSHRPLTAVEMRAVMAVADSWMSARVGEGTDLVACMLDKGVVHPFPDGLRDAWESLWDSVHALRTLHAGPVRPSGSRAQYDAIAFPPGRSLASLRRIDGKWHARVDRHRAALDAVADAVRVRRTAGVPAGTPFPHLMSGPEDIDGVVASPMLDRASFRAEGEALRHCVAGHADRARVGRVQCVSLAGPSDARSTAEFACEGGTVRLVQHKGFANVPPPTTHARVVGALRARFAADAAAIGRIDTERRRWEAHAGGDGVPVPEGATRGERESLAEAHFRNVSLWLPPSVAARGAAAWVEAAFGASRVDQSPTPRGLLARWSARLPWRRTPAT